MVAYLWLCLWWCAVVVFVVVCLWSGLSLCVCDGLFAVVSVAVCL